MIVCKHHGNTGKNNTNWKGDNVSYRALHGYIQRHKKKPEFCECCKKNKPSDLANISGEYKRDINDFEWLCRDCHMQKDNRKEELIAGNKKRFKAEAIETVRSLLAKGLNPYQIKLRTGYSNTLVYSRIRLIREGNL